MLRKGNHIYFVHPFKVLLYFPVDVFINNDSHTAVLNVPSEFFDKMLRLYDKNVLGYWSILPFVCRKRKRKIR